MTLGEGEFAGFHFWGAGHTLGVQADVQTTRAAARLPRGLEVDLTAGTVGAQSFQKGQQSLILWHMS